MGNRKMTVRLSGALVVVAVALAAYLIRPAADATAPDSNATQAVANVELPRLLDLGADKCVPCKMMAPILEELKTEYTAVFKVEFIDVWKDPAAAQPHGIRVIPTQIFFAADGTELFRHEGYFGREDILAKWRELGFEFPDKGA